MVFHRVYLYHMGIQHVSEQRLVLKTEDKVQCMGIQSGKYSSTLEQQESLCSCTCLPGVPLQMTLAVVLKRARRVVVSVMNDGWEMFAKQLRKKGCWGRAWVFSLQ